MSNENTNVVNLFKKSPEKSNVIEFSSKKKNYTTPKEDHLYKKVSGGFDEIVESFEQNKYESALFCKKGLFGKNVRLFETSAEGSVIKEVKEGGFKDKIEMLKYAFATFDTNKVDFSKIV